MAESNPKRYRELNVPFESLDQTNEALDAFFADVKAARERHRIPDVALIAAVTYTGDAGTENASFARLSLGDQFKTAALLAYGYGAEQRTQRQLLDSLAEGKV